MSEEIPIYLRKENIEEEVFNYLSKKAYEYFPFSVAEKFSECETKEEMEELFNEYLSSCNIQETWDDLIELITKKRKEMERPIMVSFFIGEFFSQIEKKYGIRDIEKRLREEIEKISREKKFNPEILLSIFVQYQREQIGEIYIGLGKWLEIKAYIADPDFLVSIVDGFIEYLENNTYCIKNICYVVIGTKYRIVTFAPAKIEYDYEKETLFIGTHSFHLFISDFERAMEILSDIIDIVSRIGFRGTIKSEVELYSYITKMIKLCKIFGIDLLEMPSVIAGISDAFHLQNVKEIQDETEDLISFYVGTEIEKEEIFSYMYEKKGKDFVISAIKSKNFEEFIRKLFRKIRSRELTALLVVSYGLYPEEYHEFYEKIRGEPREAIFTVAKTMLGLEEKRVLPFMGIEFTMWLDSFATLGFSFAEEEKINTIVANTIPVVLKYDKDADIYYAMSNGEPVNNDKYSSELIKSIQKFLRILPKHYCQEIEYRVDPKEEPSVLIIICHGIEPFIILVAPYAV